jgi:hypothetical protein
VQATELIVTEMALLTLPKLVPASVMVEPAELP